MAEYTKLTPEETERAKKAKLIEMPISMMPAPGIMPGANCGNCQFFKESFCSHPEVNMKVRDYWECKHYDNPSLKQVADKYGSSGKASYPWTY